jgi:SAM-dependent methyltransferase
VCQSEQNAGCGRRRRQRQRQRKKCGIHSDEERNVLLRMFYTTMFAVKPVGMSATTITPASAAASRWDAYHSASEPPPWESGLPVSQFVDSLSLGIDDAHSMLPLSRAADGATGTGAATSVDRGWAMDVGCGSGVSTVHLALSNHFDRCVGVDISAAGIQKARERASAAGIPVSPLPAFSESAEVVASSASLLTLLQADLFDPAVVQPFRGRFRAVFDCQVLHSVCWECTTAMIIATVISNDLRFIFPVSINRVTRRITRSEVLMDRTPPRSPRFSPLCLSLAAGCWWSLAIQTNPHVPCPVHRC